MINDKILHDYKNTLNIGEYGEDFLDYLESEIISDIITDIAESKINVYTDELWNWARYNKDAIEIAVENGFFSLDRRSFDLMDLFRAAQYESVICDLYADLDDIIRYVVLYELKGEFINIKRLIEVIDDICIDIDNNKTIGYYIDIVRDDMEDYPMLEIHLLTGTVWTKSILVEGTEQDDILQLIDDYYLENEELPVPMYTLEELIEGLTFKTQEELGEYLDNLGVLPINGGEYYIDGIAYVDEVI